MDSYSLTNVYLGVRSSDGAWEASLFARNVFNNKTPTDVSGIQESLDGQLSQFRTSLIRPSGYFQTTMTPPREVGVSFHYALGSR